MPRRKTRRAVDTKSVDRALAGARDLYEQLPAAARDHVRSPEVVDCWFYEVYWIPIDLIVRRYPDGGEETIGPFSRCRDDVSPWRRKGDPLAVYTMPGKKGKRFRRDPNDVACAIEWYYRSRGGGETLRQITDQPGALIKSISVVAVRDAVNWLVAQLQGMPIVVRLPHVSVTRRVTWRAPKPARKG